jgi:hypothetical protein
MEVFIMDYKRNKKYFLGGYTGLFIALIFWFIGLAVLAANVIVGILFIGIGVAVFYFLYLKGQIKDEEIDRICEEQVKNIRVDAMNKLGLDEEEIKEAEPIIVHGYKTVGCKRGDYVAIDTLYKLGKDGVLRTSNYQATVFFFSKDQVHSFTRDFSLIDDEKFDGTEEYFYRDIVSVSTEQGKLDVAMGSAALALMQGKSARNIPTKKVNYECFNLTTSGGTNMLGFFKKTDSDNVSRSINAMRNLLKTKKQAMV